MATPYVCKLDEATQTKAHRELYEDRKNRQGAIDAFREWIKQQRHFECPTDDVFLLGFLRAKHFSQLEAREALERFMIHRDKMAAWTKDLDPDSPEINEMIDMNVMLMLPDRDDDGRRVMLFRPGCIDPGNKEVFTTFIRLFVMLFYYNFFCDELTQVNGVVFVADWTGHTMANEMKIPMDFKKHMVTLLSKAFPARVKAIHMCNAGNLLEFIMSIVSRIIPDKLKDRLHVHQRGLETLYDYVPQRVLPDDYLPDDYTGPSAGSLKNMQGAVRAIFQQPEVKQRIKYLSSDKFFINIKDKDTDIAPASFRKLNTD